MSTHSARLSAGVTLAMIVTLALPSGATAAEIERIRAEGTLLNNLIATTFERSPTFRTLVERIDQSDVIVYVTCEAFRSSTLMGRTIFAAADSQVRFLRVQVLCMRPLADLVTILGHEFQHVVEIASAAAVVDGESFAGLFSRIGFPTCDTPGSRQFETTAAMDTGRRVHQEVLRRAAAIQSVPRYTERHAGEQAVSGGSDPNGRHGDRVDPEAADGSDPPLLARDRAGVPADR